MNAIELIQKALEAEQAGVPVDYRAICINIFQGAQAEAAKQEAEPEFEPVEEDS